MRKKSSLYIEFFAIDILACIFGSVYLLYYAPQPKRVKTSEVRNNLYFQNLTLKTNIEEPEWTKRIRSLISSSFHSYWYSCSSSDYLMPISMNCLNSSGLSLTAIESLETLFVSGLESEYEVLADFILDNKKYPLRSTNHQNFHEMGTKVLGSLIGIYGHTKNKKYISRAIECADIMAEAFYDAVPYPLIDGVKQRRKKYDFLTGNILSESSGFIFEFTALSKITGDQKYQEFVDKYLNCVYSLIKKHNNFPSYLSVDKCEAIGSNNGFSSFTVSFICNVIRLHLFSPSEISSKIVEFILDYFSRSKIRALLGNSMFDSSFCQLNYLLKSLDHSSRTNDFQKELSLICEIIMEKKLPPLKNDFTSLRSVQTKNNGFYFESSSLIDSINNGKEFHDLAILDYLNRTECGHSQCALQNQNPLVFDDIMPSESISKWLKFLFLSSSSSYSFKNDFLINEGGHFIPKM